MRKYKVKINKAGSVFISITILLGVSAINTGNNLLYLIVSALLSFMLLSGIAALYNLRGLELKLIPPKEVFAQKRENFRVLLTNWHKFPKFLLTLESMGGQVTVPVLLRTNEVHLPMIFNERGPINKVSITVKTDFPVGLFTRYYQQEVETDFVVFPKPIPWDIKLFLNQGKEKQEHTETITNLRGYDEILGIKEYSSEPMKLISWKATAKTGRLMAKEVYASAQSPIILRLDELDGDLESRISKAAYAAIKLLESNYPVGLKLDDEYIVPATGEIQKNKILKALALFHQSPRV